MEAVCAVTRPPGIPLGIQLDCCDLTVTWIDPVGLARQTKVCFGSDVYGTGLHVRDEILAVSDVTDKQGIKLELNTKYELRIHIRRPPLPPPEEEPPQEPLDEALCSKRTSRKRVKKLPRCKHLPRIAEEHPRECT